MKKTSSLRGLAAATIVAGVFAGLAGAPAHADPISAGSASASAVAIDLGGQEAVPPTPAATSDLTSDDDAQTLIDIPAAPLAVSGTLNASAAVHADSDIDSALTVNAQPLEGPYNATAVGLVEGLEVITDAVGPGISLVSAAVVRAEAVAVCTDGVVSYTANSEIIDLKIGGEIVPLNEGLEQLLDELGAGLEESGLNQVVDIQRNVLEVSDQGATVTALVVTVLAAAGDDPLGQVRIAEASVSATSCTPPAIEVAPDAPAMAEPEPHVALPRTGGETPLAGAVAVGGMALAGLALRRRLGL